MESVLDLVPPATVIDSLSHTTTFGYDAKGNLTTITVNPQGQPFTNFCVFRCHSHIQPATLCHSVMLWLHRKFHSNRFQHSKKCFERRISFGR